MATKKGSTKHHRICFVAGKSGGHILPCITMAQHAVSKHPDYEVVFFSTQALLDKQLLVGNGIIKHHIPLALDSINYKKIYLYPRHMLQFIQAFFTSLRQLRKLKPETVISTGGYVSIPVCLAAKCLGIPIELYELNAVPGKTIRMLSYIAYKIWVCFEQSVRYLPRQKCSVTHYPIKFFDTNKILTQQKALQAIHFSEERKTLLILGGSQGSIFINNAVKQLFKNHVLIKNKLQVIHQTGAADRTDWDSFYTEMGIPAIVFSYSNAIGQFYAAADVVICRSGAGTLAEINFFNKQCITIPLETTTTMHQVDNALAAAQKYPDIVMVVRQHEIEQNQHTLFNAINKSLNFSV